MADDSAQPGVSECQNDGHNQADDEDDGFREKIGVEDRSQAIPCLAVRAIPYLRPHSVSVAMLPPVADRAVASDWGADLR